MEVSKCLGAVLLVVLFACQAYIYQTYFHEDMALDELRLIREVTPAARVRETFAMFVPGDAKRLNDTVPIFARVVKPQT
jgi:hypothetical protein